MKECIEIYCNHIGGSFYHGTREEAVEKYKAREQFVGTGVSAFLNRETDFIMARNGFGFKIGG